MKVKKEQKNKNINQEMYVFIAFHVPIGSSPEMSLIRVENLLENVFLDKKIFENIKKPTVDDDEIIYRILKPLTKQVTENKEFFENIGLIADIAEDMCVHFTQMHDLSKEQLEDQKRSLQQNIPIVEDNNGGE